MNIFVLGIRENWNYLSMYGNCQAGECSSIEESERELFSMFEYWKKATLFADEFEVFDTPSMGLGVKVIEQASQSPVFFRPLSNYTCINILINESQFFRTTRQLIISRPKFR